ncbi:MAG: thioredoxin-disulfide reductase [Candidatus Komeilibacteria bacterium]|nr:thioredoxin-disulfide reductase [Candidatus Komeilibacteria bacterium]
MENISDVIIIGSGPAGYTAAIYATRGDLQTVVLAGQTPGGQLMTTTDVENFPGFPEGILGPELMEKFKQQAERFGAAVKYESVQNIEIGAEKIFKVKTESGIYETRSVIVATGASAKWLGLESETRLRGKGVSACATCDGFFFKGKKVAVVGGGDSAMEEANYLTKFAEQVYILARGEQNKLRASKIMQQRALSNPKIKFFYNTEVKEILGDDKVSGVKIVDKKTNDISDLKVDGVFVAIGHNPNTTFLKGIVDMDEKGYIKIYDGSRTSQSGIFVGGDVADYHYRQAITAAGMGCRAAMDAINYLDQKS